MLLSKPQLIQELERKSDTAYVDDKVGVLESERGYLNTKTVADANLAKENGIYLLDTGGLNSPNSSWAFTIQTSKQVGYGNRTQLAIAYYPTSVPFMYMRKSVNDAWGAWQQIATTDSTIEASNTIFASGETILEYANSLKNGSKFVVGSNMPSDAPVSAEGLVVVQSDNGGARKKVFFYQYNAGLNNGIYVRDVFNKNWLGSSGWQQIATISSKNNFTLLNGWATSSWGDNNKLRAVKVGNMVHVYGVLQAGTMTDGTIIATLPSEYRPLVSTRHFNVFDWSDNTKQFVMSIYTNGNITCRRGTITQGTSHVVFNMTYDVTNM